MVEQNPPPEPPKDDGSISETQEPVDLEQPVTTDPLSLARIALDEARARLQQLIHQKKGDNEIAAASDLLEAAQGRYDALRPKSAVVDTTTQTQVDTRVKQDLAVSNREELMKKGGDIVEKLKEGKKASIITDYGDIKLAENEILLSGGHIDSLLGILNKVNDARVLKSGQLYILTPEAGEKTNVMVVPVSTLLQAVLEHPEETELREIVFHNLEQELNHFNTDMLLKLIRYTESDLKRSGKTAAREIEDYKNKIRVGVGLAKAVRSLIEQAKAHNIDMNKAVQPVMLHGQDQPFEDVLNHKISSILFEGQNVSTSQRESFDRIMAQ